MLSKICTGFWLENVPTTSAFRSLAPSVLVILQQGVIFSHFNSVCGDSFLLAYGLTVIPFHHHHHRSHIQFQLNLQLLEEYLQRENYKHLIPPHRFIRQRNLDVM